MNTHSTIALLIIAILGVSHPAHGQMTIIPQDGTVYPTRTCYVIFDDDTQHSCNGLGITVSNFSVNYHFAIYDYSQQELSPLVAVVFGVSKENLSSVFGLFIYTAEGLMLSFRATGRCQRMPQEITCQAVNSYGEKFVGRATHSIPNAHNN